MKLISAMVAVILVSGCAWMQTKPDPNARFLFIDAGKFWMEMEFENGELCQQASTNNNPLDKGIRAGCSDTRTPNKVMARFDMIGPHGKVTTYTPTMEWCVAFQKSLTKMVDSFSDVAAMYGKVPVAHPCVAQ